MNPPRPSRRRPLAALLLAASVASAGCGTTAPPGPVIVSARIGVDPIPTVVVFENHSGSLLAWRRAGVVDRVLVHIDGHSDLDWLPDAAIARLAARDPDALATLEHNPYVLDGQTHARFAIWNFVYPAVRLGIVREYVWVVPDGTLASPEAAEKLVHDLVIGKIQMISLAEARGFRFEGGVLRGTILDIPTTICELGSIPPIREPVLLDIDLDFLTTASATTQEVTERPWITPEALVARLRERGISADMATLSLSTMGGYLPPACRWLAPAMEEALKRGGGAGDPRWAERARMDTEDAAGSASDSVTRRRAWTARFPEDGSGWYALARAAERAGEPALAREALRSAVAADPLLAHAILFEADRLWLNESYAPALDLYRSYRDEHPQGPYRAYALRREASCLSRTGRDGEAATLLREVLTIAPEHADSHLDLGLILREGGDLDGAIAELEQARRILPDLAAYATALGTTYALAGRNADAIAALQDAVARRPAWAQAQANLGLLLLRAGRPVDAAGPIAAAVALEPGDPRYARLLAALRRGGPGRAGPTPASP